MVQLIGTEDVIKKWQQENKIKIQYIKQENGGKYKAVNKGIINCKTELFCFCDSDDYFLEDTIEKFLNIWEEIGQDKTIAGIVARKGKESGPKIGKDLNIENQKINFDKLVKVYNFYGDTCRMYRTEILKKVLYPESDEKFIPETVMLAKIDQKYDIYFVNDIFSIAEYLSDGYTQNLKNMLNQNPNGYLLALNQELISKKKWTYRFKTVIAYTTFSWRRRIRVYRKCSNKLLYILAIPFSIMAYLCRVPRWHERTKKAVRRNIK